MRALGARLDHATLVGEVRDALAASGSGERRLEVGLEVELVPLGPDGTRLPLNPPEEGGLSVAELVQSTGRAEGWHRRERPGRSPYWEVPGGGSLAFEPGGQVEVRTPPTPAPGRALAHARRILEVLFRESAKRGVTLVARGMDPCNDAEDVPLALPSPRYRRQLRHYASVGPWGRRMMLMSAAIHINVDLGGRPVRRWAAANRMAPYLTAIFANSSRYQGRDTGLRSFRAEQWRRLDPTRTGLFRDEEDPVREYLAFALGARDFLGATPDMEARPFRESWEAGADLDAWRAHLTTLFPEVRPRGYLELRSIDALRPAWLAAPTLLVTGILYDPDALGAALDLLPPPDPERLVRAGRAGLADPELADTGLQLFDLALDGAARLGESGELGEALDVARLFRDRFTARGRDPGHEEDGLDPFEP